VEQAICFSLPTDGFRIIYFNSSLVFDPEEDTTMLNIPVEGLINFNLFTYEIWKAD
jgi:hypothetical protein